MNRCYYKSRLKPSHRLIISSSYMSSSSSNLAITYSVTESFCEMLISSHILYESRRDVEKAFGHDHDI
uniref:Uncharacterized protein n=1 Tax=Glossina brevipalpis TaxID=37001 RepID=A0A1A9WU90_9MUSC